MNTKKKTLPLIPRMTPALKKMLLEGEELRYIEGSAKNYISNKGRVFSHCPTARVGGKWQLLKPASLPSGYKYISISMGGKCKTRFVHRLVALAFLPIDDKRRYVNHINGKKEDNRAENLEWVTNRENILHARDVLKTLKRGVSSSNHRLTYDQLVEVWDLYMTGRYKRYELAEKFGLARTTISYLLNGVFYQEEYAKNMVRLGLMTEEEALAGKRLTKREFKTITSALVERGLMKGEDNG